MRCRTCVFGLAAAAGLALGAAAEAGDYARAGWTAELSTLAHDVDGICTIVDENTLRFEMFDYDGLGAPAGVYVYLAEQDTQASFVAGLQVGEDLRGPAYVNATFEVDLPPGQTMDDWNAVSIWCVFLDLNFGSGTFVAPPCPTDFNGDGSTNAADLGTLLASWGDLMGGTSPADLNDDGFVNAADLGDLLASWGPC
ncbi:MAG: DM13 domain-containing protein [Planctomycetota bacterium]|nr:DM13 domain-containing protein [Planctomycetota bacterium]